MDSLAYLSNELLLEVFDYLGKPDLCTLTLVCHRFKALARPLLFRDLKEFTIPQLSIAGFECLQRNLEKEPQLRNSVHAFRVHLEDDGQIWWEDWEYVKQFTNLRSFVLDIENSDGTLDGNLFRCTFMDYIPGFLDQLRDIELWGEFTSAEVLRFTSLSTPALYSTVATTPNSGHWVTSLRLKKAPKTTSSTYHASVSNGFFNSSIPDEPGVQVSERS